MTLQNILIGIIVLLAFGSLVLKIASAYPDKSKGWKIFYGIGALFFGYVITGLLSLILPNMIGEIGLVFGVVTAGSLVGITDFIHRRANKQDEGGE